VTQKLYNIWVRKNNKTKFVICKYKYNTFGWAFGEMKLMLEIMKAG